MGGPRGKGDVGQMIRESLREGQTAIDVGAAYGEMTKIMLSCVGPTGTVIAVEPSPTGPKVDALAEVGRAQPNLRIHRTALGETIGAVVPLFRAVSTGASRWHGDNQPPVDVPLTTLDAIAPAAVDLVKLDVQGSEAHILEGAARTLAVCPVWILEFWPWGLSTAKRTPQDVLALLRAAGLTPRWPKGEPITDDDLHAWIASIGRGESNTHCNILATR